MKKIVIGGGQGSGKTSVLNELKKEFYCINEATSYLIGKGYVPEEHTFLEFQNEITKKQKELENSANTELVFLDRCLIDTILYLEEEKLEVPEELLQDIKNANYTQVFFLEMLPEKYWVMPAHKQPRVTDYEKGTKRTKQLLRIYNRFYIPIKLIPVMSLEARVEIIKKATTKID